jgi:hypothetical protein
MRGFLLLVGDQGCMGEVLRDVLKRIVSHRTIRQVFCRILLLARFVRDEM